MKRFALMLVALGAIGLTTSGCKKDSTEEAPAAEETAAKPAEAEAAMEAEEPAAEEAAAEEAAADEAAAEEAAEGEEAAAEGEAAQTGVAECDQLIEKYTACVNEKAPAEVREETLKAFQANVEAWEKAAQDESAKQALAEGCTQTTEQLKKSSEAWGCEW